MIVAYDVVRFCDIFCAVRTGYPGKCLFFVTSIHVLLDG